MIGMKWIDVNILIWLRSIGKSNRIAVENLFNRQCIRITALEFGHRSINLVSVHPIRPFNPVRFSPNNLCWVSVFFPVFIMACRNCNKPWIRCLDYLNIDTNIARSKLDGNRVFRYDIKFKWCAYTTMLYKYNLFDHGQYSFDSLIIMLILASLSFESVQIDWLARDQRKLKEKFAIDSVHWQHKICK